WLTRCTALSPICGRWEMTGRPGSGENYAHEFPAFLARHRAPGLRSSGRPRAVMASARPRLQRHHARDGHHPPEREVVELEHRAEQDVGAILAARKGRSALAVSRARAGRRATLSSRWHETHLQRAEKGAVHLASQR